MGWLEIFSRFGTWPQKQQPQQQQKNTKKRNPFLLRGALSRLVCFSDLRYWANCETLRHPVHVFSESAGLQAGDARGYLACLGMSWELKIPWLQPEDTKWVFPKIGLVNPPKWMVYFMENPIKMNYFGGTIIFGNTQVNNWEFCFINNWEFISSTIGSPK